MKRTNFDTYLDEQLKDPELAARSESAGDAWDVAVQLAAIRQKAGLRKKNSPSASTPRNSRSADSDLPHTRR